jgi:cobalt/nickel transport system permease protein
MHVHEPLDRIMFSNAWRFRSPLEKLVLGGGLLLHASVLPALPWSVVIFLIAAAAALVGAQIPVRAWLRFLTPQIAFITVAVLPLLFTLHPLGLREAEASRAVTVWLRGTSAAACLTLLSLTTPAPDLVFAARRLRVPASLVELAFLTYRLIASLHQLLGRTRLGLDVRLRGNRVRLSTVSLSAGNLLVRSLQTAQRLERGVSLRGVDGLQLLPARTQTSPSFLTGAIALQAALLGAAWTLRGVFPW